MNKKTGARAEKTAGLPNDSAAESVPKSRFADYFVKFKSKTFGRFLGLAPGLQLNPEPEVFKAAGF